MKVTRRSFLAASGLLCAPRLAAARTREVYTPERYGAHGDGRTDDTQALQLCLRAAPPGAAVRLRRGAVYRVDTNWSPTHAQIGGVKLKDGQILQLNGAELKALPSVHNNGSVVSAYRAHGWRIEGPGRITGERDIHLGDDGEWGMGISCWGAHDWTIGHGVEVTNCWGDGIYLGYSQPGGDFCERYLIDRVHIWDCRRCGIGHVAGRDGRIVAPHIHKIDGTGPAAGIDFEADLIQNWNRNVTVSGGKIYECGIGIDISTANENIVITGVDVSGENSGIILGKPIRNIRIVDNPRIASTLGGREGAALRTAAQEDSAAIADVLIAGNSFFGGGDFVLDIVGADYRNFVIERNRIHASNPGVQGVARLGRVTFTGNECVVEATAGKADYFLYFADSIHGGNVYRNRSRHSMHSILVRDTDLGGDRYEGPNLRRVVEPR